jgi:hypothetical protein
MSLATSTVKSEVPATVGVPEISPVAVRFRFVGSDPTVMDHV